MGRILEFIERETEGHTFTSFKRCYDNFNFPSIEYETQEDNYENLEKYAEDNQSPKPRNLTERAKICMNGAPLFKYFLDGSRKVYKLDDIQYDKQVFPIIGGQISVSCCGRKVDDDGNFLGFHNVKSESYSTLCLPVKANGEGIDHNIFFNNLCNNIKDKAHLRASSIHLEKVLYYSTKTNGNETYENKGIARVQDEMIDCEKKIVAELVSEHLLNQESYLIKDGSIQYKPVKTGNFRELSHIRNNYRHVVGVSKKFNPT